MLVSANSASHQPSAGYRPFSANDCLTAANVKGGGGSPLCCSLPSKLSSAANRRPPPLLLTVFIHHRQHWDGNSVLPPNRLLPPLPPWQQMDLPQQVAAILFAPPAIDLPCCCPLVQDTGVFLLIMAPFQPEEDAAQMRWGLAFQGSWRCQGTHSSWPIPVLGAQGVMTSRSSCASLGILFLRQWFAAYDDGRGALCLTGWPGTSPTWGLPANIYFCLFFSSLFGLTRHIMSASCLLPTRPTLSKYSTRRTSVGIFVDLATHPRSRQLLPTKHSCSGICFVGDCSGMSPSR